MGQISMSKSVNVRTLTLAAGCSEQRELVKDLAELRAEKLFEEMKVSIRRGARLRARRFLALGTGQGER